MVGAADWSYDSSWADLGQCSGGRQSPINIDSGLAMKSYSNSDELQASALIERVTQTLHTVTMANPAKGHSLKYQFTPEIQTENHKCPQFHLHINQSEHKIDNKFYFAELHIVCYKNYFSDLGSAIADDNMGNLAVFGFFIDEGYAPRGNIPVQDMIDSHDKYNPRPFSMQIPRPDDLRFYYRYSGSLTTPTCNEVVTWTVFKDPIKVSPMQKWLMSNWAENLVENNRPVQPLNQRQLQIFVPEEKINNGFRPFNYFYNYNPIMTKPVETYNTVVQESPVEYVQPQTQRQPNWFWMWYYLMRG